MAVLLFYHFGLASPVSSIPDPGSRIPDPTTAPKEEGEIFLAKTLRIILFTQKFVIKL